MTRTSRQHRKKLRAQKARSRKVNLQIHFQRVCTIQLYASTPFSFTIQPYPAKRWRLDIPDPSIDWNSFKMLEKQIQDINASFRVLPELLEIPKFPFAKPL